jgi:hypothetical protein
MRRRVHFSRREDVDGHHEKIMEEARLARIIMINVLVIVVLIRNIRSSSS